MDDLLPSIASTGGGRRKTDDKDRTIMRWILGAALAATPLFSGEAEARSCAVTVEVRDALVFSLNEITVDSRCESFSLTLKHIGNMPASSMGHNWVLTRTEDFDGAVTDGQRSGADNHFVKPGDERVLAATKVIGGGDETTISFDPSILEPGGDYTFFCSFPAHFVLMRGKLIVL
jgi:azurin